MQEFSNALLFRRCTSWRRSVKIEFRPINAVKPYPGHPRAADAAIKVVANLIHDFGFHNPILLDSAGMVLSGYIRLAAMQSLGMAEVPIVVCVGLSPDQIRALRLADSRVTTFAAWLEELLLQEGIWHTLT